MPKHILKWFSWPIIVLIELYRFILSPLLPRSCRFFPTCSAYAVEALKKHGIFKGLWFALKRVKNCHPGNPGGYDPVP